MKFLTTEAPHECRLHRLRLARRGRIIELSVAFLPFQTLAVLVLASRKSNRLVSRVGSPPISPF